MGKFCLYADNRLDAPCAFLQMYKYSYLANFIEDEIIKLGGTPICYRTGNSWTRYKVNKEELPFGGEYSGHMYFRDKWPGIDSGLYNGLRMLEILSKTDKKISELSDGMNVYYATPEIKVKVTDDTKFKIVEKMKEYCESKGYNIVTLDGVKAKFDDGFALVRASNTGPNITMRFEAKTEEKLKEYQSEFEGELNKYL